jgi:hypothetical protein
MKPMKTCSNCQHFYPDGNESGFCRRFPPMPFIAKPFEDNKPLHIHSAWPPTRPTAYCGEFLEKPNAGIIDKSVQN